MTLTLDSSEIGEALVKYLADRGVLITISQITMTSERVAKGGVGNYKTVFTATIKDVDLPPKQGPYR